MGIVLYLAMVSILWKFKKMALDPFCDETLILILAILCLLCKIVYIFSSYMLSSVPDILF